jgi:hypothetical protein
MLYSEILSRTFDKYSEGQLALLSKEYPYMDAARVALALRQTQSKYDHDAALVLDNPAWVHFLKSVEPNTNTSAVFISNNRDKMEKATLHNSPIGDAETGARVEATENADLNMEAVAMLTDEEGIASSSKKQEVPDVVLHSTMDGKKDMAMQEELSGEMDTAVATDWELENSKEIEDATTDVFSAEVAPSETEGAPMLETSLQWNALAEDIKGINSIGNNDQTNEVQGALVPLEPYHTIDYFASQGIKVDNALPGGDKLSVQLKSFTAWLKTMRKIGDLPVADDNNSAEIKHVEIVALAEDSLVNNEILTENMVDVLLAQGRTNDAVATLQKLSLMNQEKSAYFAARIEKIKEH